VEIYSTQDGTGGKLSVHKERVGPGAASYFIHVSTPSGGQRCALNASSATILSALLRYAAPEIPPPGPNCV
jgi:hypothetical protein